MTKRVLLVVGFLLAIGVAATLIAGPAKSQTLEGADRGSQVMPPCLSVSPSIAL